MINIVEKEAGKNHMTSLEAKIIALLVECEKLLEPPSKTASKLVVTKWENNGKIKSKMIASCPIKDHEADLSGSFWRAIGKIELLESFDIAKQAFEQDKVFSVAAESTGNQAQYWGVLEYLIKNAGKIRNNCVSIDHAKALKHLRSLRKLLTGTLLKYEATARVFGVNLRCKTLSLPDGVTLYRLNRKELNDRQPVISSFERFSDNDLTGFPAELRVSITVQVDPSQKDAFITAANDALKTANDKFSKILRTILVISSGEARLHHVELKGGLGNLGTSFVPGSREGRPHPNIILGVKDTVNIKTVYDLLAGSENGDKTLSLALHRYLLGRQRSNWVDKLIDYVIAFEAILLTQGGNAIHQELSYRFALNGASLLSKFYKPNIPNELFKKMRSAYSTRSIIVHGGEDEKRDNKLKEGGFNNPNELCNFLEESFRYVVLGLSSMKPKERPYRQPGGWEILIWPQK